jgi:hypothetical protein
MNARVNEMTAKVVTSGIGALALTVAAAFTFVDATAVVRSWSAPSETRAVHAGAFTRPHHGTRYVLAAPAVLLQ